MGKIFCVMGKSSSGKDTLYQMLKKELEFDSIVPYTTRPIREGETNGVEYHFVTEEEVAELEEAGKIIELRAYNTVHGIWKYFTADDAQIDLEHRNYLMIGTVEAYQKLKAYYGEEHLVPIYIEVDDGIRLQRALNREKLQEQPKYAEMCRRFLADEVDFSEEKLAEAGIEKRFVNKTLDETKQELMDYIRSYVG
ncbi:MAG: guanylate kinase [Lachnospiraceae bacterium]|nr:guanylate kinase [Lachnospiraceae bacterium]MDD6183967.1 guanylate kinase [Lachnospiraceae bacterium]MDD7378052.1 guanylate kinase [Lachnospiraceae bacterium]MDY4617034.1 guanylate kinase [Lachnospiraceae bacterium]MDY5775753.1 guanylate kinase [Lachnospiraceae bacterium]